MAAAVDGKTLLSRPGDAGPDLAVCQVAHPENRQAYWQLRAVRRCFISAAGCPAFDQLAIPAETNEMGIFAQVFAGLEAVYGVMIEVSSMDSGYCSLANATLVAGVNVRADLRSGLRGDSARLTLPNQGCEHRASVAGPCSG
jgi:hypothetical protein